MAEERKLVTVLFADIVGSTAIGASHDPEVVRRTLSRAFAEVRRVLETHGGTVEKFIGDAVMAVFGIPQTHDDDADRAVRAAFALRESMAALNASGRFALELRIGINSGQVVTGSSGETLVTGEAVNAGSRVQSAATPNEILVGALTRQLTEGTVRYGPSREFDAKGIGRMTAWPAEALVSALPSQRRGIAGRGAPLIGRDGELRLLVDSHRRVASDGRAALVTVFGNAGVGKSRLVAELVETIGSDRVRQGRCLPYGEGITYWPVVEILRADAGITALDSHEEATRKLRAAVIGAFAGASEDAESVARRLSVLAGTASRESALPDVPVESVQQELRWGLRRYLERRAAGGPLTLVFDDIHWAEPALLDLVEHLTEWSRAPLLLVCTARPDLRELRSGWGGGLMNASAIRLEPLSPEESARLIGEILDVDALPDDLRARIVARSEGNPLYVEEFLRMLLDAGHLVRRDGRFVAVASLDALVVPATLQGLIAARLDRVPIAERRALQRAAVIGKVFWPEAILAQGQLDGRLEDLLMEAARRDLVSELDDRGLGGGRAWTFKHILIRDVAYDAIPKAERARAHDTFGRWLEQTAGERLDEYADIVAHHAEQALLLARELGEADAGGLGERAYGLLGTRGAKAAVRGDRRAALAFFRRALDAAQELGLPASERLVMRGQVVRNRVAVEGSPEALEEAAALVTELRALPPTTVLVELLQVLSDQQSDRDPAAAGALDREAVAAARAQGDAETIATALFRSHWVPFVNGDLQAQRRALGDALAHIEATGAAGTLATVVGWLGANAHYRGAFVEAVAYYARADELASADRSSLQRAMVLRGVMYATLWRGELDAAVAVARQAVAVALDTGSRQIVGIIRMHLGEALAATGQLAAAREEYGRSIERLAVPALTGFRAETRQRLAQTLIRLGDIAQARHEAETARAETAGNDVYTVATSTAALAAVHAAEGRADEAERLYREAVSGIGRTGYRTVLMELRRDYAAFLIAQRRAAEARPLLLEVRTFYDTTATPFERDRVDELLRRCAEVGDRT